ncbi:MAG: hypothetical protein E7645_05385 [Ruminococcaceae bacterium]|nr:hypothetical protein [Oscillospiraceae bacterium]
MTRRTKETEMLRGVRIAVCGDLPTVCEYLNRQGVIHIDKYTDAVEIRREADYHLILIYAPQAEGMLGTYYQMRDKVVPIRMLNEPCCHGMLTEIKMTVRNLARTLSGQDTEVAPRGESTTSTTTTF